jgi:hypothetical protein
VAAVAPLARDPAIQQAIADQVTAQVLTYLDVPGLTNQLVDALAERGLTPLLATQLRTLSGPIASGVEGFTHDRLAVFRSVYLDSVPATVLPHDAAAVLYDTIIRFLRLGLRTVLVLALVVAAGRS